jgi:SAM-dependent methyltransferase
MTDITTEQEQKRIRDYRMFQINSFYPNPATYRVMMVDRDRNEFYERAIKENVKDKVVLDVGAGLGMLSLMACRAGAKKVYALEVNPVAIDVLKKLKNEENLLQLEIIEAPSWEAELPEQVDIILHEMFGPMLLEEMCLLTLGEVKKWLKPEGKMIPEEFGFKFKFFDSEKVESIRYISKFSKTYDSVMQSGQAIVEDYIHDNGRDWLNFGPWTFENYPKPEEEFQNQFKFFETTKIDSLWCVPYIKQGDDVFKLNKPSRERTHWGNSFMRFGSWTTMDEGTDIRLLFKLDESLGAFNVGVDLPRGG